MVYPLLSLQFLLFMVLSAFAFLFSFYFPGSFFVTRFRFKSPLLHILCSFAGGIVLWATQGAIFGYFQVRWATYIYVAFFIFQALRRRKFEESIWQKFLKQLRKAPKKIWALVIIGTIGQSIPMFGSGLLYPKGVEFFQSNAVDGILHLAYIQAITRSFPPREPGAVSLYISNYHYWSDLVIAELTRVWQIPSSHLFFQFMPILISVLTALATYFVIRVWGGSKIAAFWALFLLYFAGDAAYLFVLLLHQSFGFYTPAIDNGVTQFLNVPHTFAKMLFMVGLIPLTLWIKTNKKKWLVLTLLFFAPLVGFKIYFGMFVALGFSLLIIGSCIETLVRTKNIFTVFKKNWAGLFTLLAFAGISALIYFPVNKSAGGLFYSPLEWPKIFLGRDAINWDNWWQRRATYQWDHNTRDLFIVDAIAIFICLVSIHGTRLLGFWPNRSLFKKLGWKLLLFFVPGIFLFIYLGLYTLQVSGLFNVFNFFVVSTVPLALFLPFTLEELQVSKRWPSKVLLAVIVILTLPRPLHDAYHFLEEYRTNTYETLVPNGELAALAYIRNNTSPTALVQSHPGNIDDEKAPYVSFFANRFTYLSGPNLLESHNQPIQTQKSELHRILGASSNVEFASELKVKNIEYVYLQKKDDSQPLKFKIERPYLEVVFENDDAMVLRRMYN